MLKSGQARRVIFFYPGEEGTYVDFAQVTLFANGIVHIVASQEETTTHLQNCEVLWAFEAEGEDRSEPGSKVRFLKPKAGASSGVGASSLPQTPPPSGPNER